MEKAFGLENFGFNRTTKNLPSFLWPILSAMNSAEELGSNFAEKMGR